MPRVCRAHMGWSIRVCAYAQSSDRAQILETRMHCRFWDRDSGMSDEATNLRLVRSEEGGQPLLAEARPWRDGLLDGPSAGEHIVHFYEDDEFLFDSVAHYAAAGLAARE